MKVNEVITPRTTVDISRKDVLVALKNVGIGTNGKFPERWELGLMEISLLFHLPWNNLLNHFNRTVSKMSSLYTKGYACFELECELKTNEHLFSCIAHDIVYQEKRKELQLAEV